MTTLQFADTYNLVTFLDKPGESEGFEQIVDFLNASFIRYALTVNPTIYTSCIQQLWATIKVKTVNGEVQLQALVDGKKIIITKETIRRDLQLEDAKVFVNQQVGDMSNHKRIYVTPSHTKKVLGNMKREGKGFSGRVTPLFPSMMKKQKPRKPKRKDTEAPQPNGPITNVADEAFTKENVSKHSNDPLLNGEDSMKLKELMELCINLQQRVIDLESTKTTQGSEIASLKRRVKKLENKNKSRTHKLKRLHRVGRSARVVSSDEASLGDQEDASK
ncbi:hypothetical protein Tco_0738764 [Tanacetum coccineum]